MSSPTKAELEQLLRAAIQFALEEQETRKDLRRIREETPEPPDEFVSIDQFLQFREQVGNKGEKEAEILSHLSDVLARLDSLKRAWKDAGLFENVWYRMDDKRVRLKDRIFQVSEVGVEGD